MPSVASETSAIQHTRHQQPAHRNRPDSAGREPASPPFADLLDSTAPSPANEPPAAPRKSRAERSDDARPTENRRKADHAARRDDSRPARETREPDARDASDETRAADEAGESAKSSEDAAASSETETGKATTTADEQSEAKPEAGFAAALTALVGEAAQPAVPVEITVVAAVPVTADAAAIDAAAAGAASAETPAIDPLAALKAAQQAAAPSGAAEAAQDQAAAAEGAKASAESGAETGTQAEVKTDAKKADGKPDAKPLLQLEGKPDAPVAALGDAAHQDGEAARKDGQAPEHGIKGEAAKAEGDKPEAKPHAATDNSAQAKTHAASQAAGGASNGQAANLQALEHASAQATAAIANIPAHPPALTASHIQTALAAQLQAGANASPAVPLDGLGVEIARQALAGKQSFEIRLDPAELGRIEVKLDIDGDGNATTRVVVERADTLDLLKRDASQLERALQQAGLKTSDNALEFSLRQEAFQQNDDQGSSKGAQIVLPDEETPVRAQRQSYGRLLGTGGGLDIRI